jgi:hypothetical protein
MPLREACDLLARSFRATARKHGAGRVGVRKRLRRIALEQSVLTPYRGPIAHRLGVYCQRHAEKLHCHRRAVRPCGKGQTAANV